jgi:hypothetical protein
VHHVQRQSVQAEVISRPEQGGAAIYLQHLKWTVPLPGHRLAHVLAGQAEPGEHVHERHPTGGPLGGHNAVGVADAAGSCLVRGRPPSPQHSGTGQHDLACTYARYVRLATSGSMGRCNAACRWPFPWSPYPAARGAGVPRAGRGQALPGPGFLPPGGRSGLRGPGRPAGPSPQAMRSSLEAGGAAPYAARRPPSGGERRRQPPP